MSTSRHEALRAALSARGQEHVFRFWEELGAADREHLLGELEHLSWDELDPLIETHVRHAPPAHTVGELQPAQVYPAHPTGDCAARGGRSRPLSKSPPPLQSMNPPGTHRMTLIGEGDIGGEVTRIYVPQWIIPLPVITRSPDVVGTT